MDEKEIQKIVDRFLTSHEAGLIVSDDEGLEQVQENARHCALSASLERDNYAWWSALPENVQQKWLANPKTPTIREAWEESQTRLKALNFSRASLGLEGFYPSAEVEAEALKFINGEITMSEFIHGIGEQAERSDFREEET
jgi:hypothetical protein